MFQVLDPDLVRTMARDRSANAHVQVVLAARRAARRERLLRWLGYGASLLRTRSTGVPSLSGTASSRS
jgi:hypothetical protein